MIISLFPFLSPILIGSQYTYVSLLGKSILYSYSLFLILSINFSQHNIKKSVKPLLLPIFLFFIYIVSRSINIRGLLVSFQFSLLMVIFLLRYDHQSKFLNTNYKTVFRLILFLTLLEFFSPGIFFANKNYLSTLIIIYGSFFVSLAPKGRFFYVTLILLLLLFSGSRAVLLSAFISILVVPRLMSTEINRSNAIKLAVTIILFITFGWLVQTIYSDYSRYNLIVMASTGKNIESGRIEIWEMLISNLHGLEILFGKGGEWDIKSILGNNLSPHSMYVYLLVNYGIIGLALFLWIVLTSIAHLAKEKHSASLFLALTLLMRDLFETSLVTNNYPIAFFFWVVILTSNFEKGVFLTQNHTNRPARAL